MSLRILVIRPDRIGDVVLSTPVLQALRKEFPHEEIQMLVQSKVSSVVEHNPYLNKLFLLDPSHRGIRGFIKLVSDLRSENFDVAITLQVSFIVTLAVFLAGIPKRIGPYSKWYSFLLFNFGRRQSRSSVEMHEADYNLMLLRDMDIRLSGRVFEPSIIVDADAKDRMRKKFPFEYIVVHPGMGGSALNWPETHYAELIRFLVSNKIKVVLTGSEAESKMLDRILGQDFESMSLEYRPEKFIGTSNPVGLAEMIGVLSLSQVVVAPSTGPLHMAVALGKPTVSVFPPIRVQSALRWGPYVRDENEQKHSVMVPDAHCGQDFKCAGKRCHYYFCMEKLGVDEVGKEVLRLKKN